MKELGIFIGIIGIILGSLWLNTWSNKHYPSTCYEHQEMFGSTPEFPPNKHIVN